MSGYAGPSGFANTSWGLLNTAHAAIAALGLNPGFLLHHNKA